MYAGGHLKRRFRMIHVRHRFTVEKVLSKLMGKMYTLWTWVSFFPATSVLAQQICVQTDQGGSNGEACMSSTI